MNWWSWCRNKNDVKDEEQVVSYEDDAAFAKENDLMFMEASAKTGYNVDNIFISTAREIIHRIKQGKMTLSEKDGIKRNAVRLISLLFVCCILLYPLFQNWL